MIRELLGHSAAYTLANLVSRGTILMWLIILPRFMRAADYGALGLIVTVAAIVNVLAPLEVSQALARFYPGAPEEERRRWAATAWTFTLAMLGAGAAAAMLVAPWLNRLLLGSNHYLSAFRIAVVYFVLNSGFIFMQNLFRWAFRPRDYTVVTLVFALVTLVLSVGLAALVPDPLVGVLIGMVIGAGAGLALGIIGLRRTLGLGIERGKLRRLLRFSLPLVPASFSILVSTYASRFILNDKLTLTDVGLFTWASQLASVPALLLLGVQAAITPLVMRHHADPEMPIILARSFETIFSGALWLCIALGLYAPELVSLLGYPQFAGAAPLVILLAPAMLLFQVYVFAPGFAVAERTGLQLCVSVLGAVSAVLFNYLFVSAAGVIGAAVATLASSSLFIGGWFLLSHRLYPVPVEWRRLGLLIGAAAACAAAGTFVAPGGVVRTMLVKALLLFLLAALAAVLGFARISQLKRLIAQRPYPRRING
jgi:O-antigen/teichoic acid export membrane protein